MTQKLRVAVVGVGHHGERHARILAGLDAVDLVGVVDADEDRARAVAERYSVPAYVNAEQVLDHVDAVTVAVPTVAHVGVAMPFLTRRIGVLVEKPIAASIAEADRLIDLAERHGAVLATGHTERFNPAVTAARPLIHDPRFIEVHRLGTFPERSLDIDVIFDLMIHDIDVLLALVGSEVVSVEAVGVAVLTPRTDIANARIRFASGCVANLTASRISRERVRKIRFFQHDAYISIDYGAKELEVYRLVRVDGRPVIQGGRLPTGDDEPLRLELEDFVEAVRTGRAPQVTGRAGREALAVATLVSQQMAQG